MVCWYMLDRNRESTCVRFMDKPCQSCPQKGKADTGHLRHSVLGLRHGVPSNAFVGVKMRAANRDEIVLKSPTS